jgi:hypothetical protein
VFADYAGGSLAVAVVIAVKGQKYVASEICFVTGTEKTTHLD